MDYWLPESSSKKKGKRKNRRSPSRMMIVGALLGLLVIGSVAFALIQAARVNRPAPAAAGSDVSSIPTATLSVFDANATSLAQGVTTPDGGDVILPTITPIANTASANTAAPRVAPALPQTDQNLISAANTNTDSFNSMRFDFNITLGASDDVESAQMSLQGRGNFTGIKDFNTFRGQLLVQKGIMTLPDGSIGEFSFEMRFVEGSMYMRAESPTTCMATRWLQITLEDMLSSMTLLNPAGGLDLSQGFDPSDLNMNEADTQAFEDMLDLLSFGRFVTTTRLPDTADGKAIFSYAIDLPGFLQSEEFFTFLGSFSQFGGPSIPQDQMAQLQISMQMLLPQILQNFGLTAYQEIDIARQLNTGYRLDLEAGLNSSLLGSNNPNPVLIAFDFQVNLSEHGGLFPVDLPQDAIRLSTLDTSSLPPEAMIPCSQ